MSLGKHKTLFFFHYTEEDYLLKETVTRPHMKIYCKLLSAILQ